MRQVHGSHVVNADESTAMPDADAAIARKPGTVCAVLIADCMPILLCNRAATVVAIAHAGWRGLSSGVIENTVRATDVAPGELLAYLGPAIGRDAFEVGTDVRDAFTITDPVAAQAFQSCGRNKWLADLRKLALSRFAASGVQRVFGADLCTYRDASRFYSYRRDKVTGRMAALIWLDRDQG